MTWLGGTTNSVTAPRARLSRRVDRAVKSVRRWAQAGSLFEIVPEDLEVRRVPVPRFPYLVAYLADEDVADVVTSFSAGEDAWVQRLGNQRNTIGQMIRL